MEGKLLCTGESKVYALAIVVMLVTLTCACSNPHWRTCQWPGLGLLSTEVLSLTADASVQKDFPSAQYLTSLLNKCSKSHCLQEKGNSCAMSDTQKIWNRTVLIK